MSHYGQQVENFSCRQLNSGRIGGIPGVVHHANISSIKADTFSLAGSRLPDVGVRLRPRESLASFRQTIFRAN